MKVKRCKKSASGLTSAPYRTARPSAVRRHTLSGEKIEIKGIHQARDEELDDSMEHYFFSRQVHKMAHQEQGRTPAARPSHLSSRNELRDKLRERYGNILEEQQQVALSKLRYKQREYGRVDRVLLATKRAVDRMMGGFVEEYDKVSANQDTE
mmetsp:Transcript_2424/g.3191  ORF Transcript_2424/g.3191 Transcript_2424/m.3191 type:complete len:153 (+) Transcript_2424:29-487(+)|eukprot:CAMPEP_0172500194 /NCGR_PEP_ID=MMETSP1066-20121228/135644_1 /TAXON_ID=671091 /ORGANISM="Coscinodiscus wailesii, Strain CCMP2513" /LENGTH=152 /DNA_ID=CAMNT_0013274307 /DNA_START=26 /DNA_END=484 /DNA_ORIENTATION=-